MTPTILFDLDDTLLLNRTDSFMPAYLQVLSGFLANRFKGDLLIQNLLFATQKMLANTRPDRTLEQVFDSYFYPALGIERSEIQSDLDEFYGEIFPTLRPLTSVRPEAIRLVERVFEQGYRVAVATNPLFPRTAILQRLSWAGLPVTDYPFHLVSSYENFHFAKPNPAYFAEILAQLGWPEGPAIMVGNDEQNDTLPAQSAGLATFLIREIEPSSSPEWDTPHFQGNFRDIAPWLDRFEGLHLQADCATAESLRAVLVSTPAAFDILVRQQPADQLLAKPAPGEWCLTEIICHLRDVTAEVDIPRVEKVLREDNPFLPGMVTDPWAEQRGYCTQDGTKALAKLIDIRMQLIDLLAGLNPADWDRPSRHAIFGPTNLRELVGFTATHDKTHIRQAMETIAAVAKSAAGG